MPAFVRISWLAVLLMDTVLGDGWRSVCGYYCQVIRLGFSLNQGGNLFLHRPDGAKNKADEIGMDIIMFFKGCL